MLILIYTIYLACIPIISTKIIIGIFPILVYLIIYSLLSRDRLEELYLMLILITPLSTHQQFYKFAGVTFSEMIIIVYFIVILVKKLISKKKIVIHKIKYLDLVFLIFFIIVFIGVIYSPYNTINIISDAKVFFCFLLVYKIVKQYVKDNSFEVFLNLLVNCITYSSIIILVIFILKDVNSLGLIDWEGRYGNAFQTLYVITIPYSIYMLSKHYIVKSRKIFIIVSLLIQIVLLSLNGNRTITMLTSLLIIYIIIRIFIDGIKFRRLDIYLKNIKLIIILLVLILIGLIYLFKTNSLIIQRIMDIMNGIDTVGNMNSRVITNSYNMNILKNNISGLGVGAQMYMLTPTGYIYSIRPFIDNALVSILYKLGGVKGGIIILSISSYIILGMIRQLFKKRIFIILLSSSIIFNGCVLTSQILTSLQVTVVFLALIIYINKN